MFRQEILKLQFWHHFSYQRLIKLIGLVVLVCSISETPNAISEQVSTEYVSAEIYYIGWHILTIGSLSPADVRSRYWHKTIVDNSGEISQFVKWLQLENLRSATGDDFCVTNCRLVIDLQEADGTIRTVAASQFCLYDPKTMKNRAIDEAFKANFLLVPYETDKKRSK